MRRHVGFTGLDAGTVELSLGLHASRQLSDKVLRSHLLLHMTSDRSEAGHGFPWPPHVAMRVGLYLHRLVGVRRTVSEDSRCYMTFIWSFLLITCTCTFSLTCRE